VAHATAAALSSSVHGRQRPDSGRSDPEHVRKPDIARTTRNQENHMSANTSPTLIGTTTFQVEGMTCDHCREAVTTEVSAVPGVEAVNVDVEAGTVTISADQPVDRSDIAAAVDEAGYTLLP